MKLKIGDDVTIQWFVTVECMNKEQDIYRFLYGKIIDIITENTLTKYKVKYINDLLRWETKKNIELWDKKNVTKRDISLTVPIVETVPIMGTDARECCRRAYVARVWRRQERTLAKIRSIGRPIFGL